MRDLASPSVYPAYSSYSSSSDYYCFLLQGCHLHLNCKVKNNDEGFISHYLHLDRIADQLFTCKNASWCNPRNTHCRLPQRHTKFDYSKKKTLLCFWRHYLGLPVTVQSTAKANNSGCFIQGAPHTTFVFIWYTRQLYHEVTVTCGHLTCDNVNEKGSMYCGVPSAVLFFVEVLAQQLCKT